MSVKFNTGSIILFCLFQISVAYGQIVPLQATPTPIPLPQDFVWIENPDNGNFYVLVNEAMTWNEANNFAESMGGHLLTISSQEENDFAFLLAKSMSINTWLGLMRVTNGYGWVTGEPLEYTNWASGAPNNIGGIEIVAEFIQNGEWDDITSGMRKQFLVEIEGELAEKTATPTWTPTSTPTPTPTSTPTTTPTPTPTPPNYLSLNGETLEANQLTMGNVRGFELGRVDVAALPEGNYVDGKGIEISLAPGRGVFLVSNHVIDADSLMSIKSLIRTSDSNVSVALVALNHPIDEQIAFANITSDELPVSEYRDINLIYHPPSDQMQLALQAVNSPFSTLSTKIWVDRFAVEPYELIVQGENVELETDGSFDNGLQNLLVNTNDVDGEVTPIFESLGDIAIRLETKTENIAANIGTRLMNVENGLPVQLVGQVNVTRESVVGNSIFAFVFSNGFQNLGLFRKVSEIPSAEQNLSENIMVGGDFTVANPNSPIFTFVQIGGVNAPSRVVVDGLAVKKK